MRKKLNFIFKNLIKITIGQILNIFIHRDRNVFALSLRVNNKDLFMHNTKYLFLYLQNKDNIYPIWLCDDDEMHKKFKEIGIKHVYKRKSLEGFYYTLKAKYWFYDFQPTSISDYWSSNAICCNLWHGIPLKKIEFDADVSFYTKLNLIQKFIFKILRVKHNIIIANNEYDSNCFESAFLINKNKIKIIGSPRLDALYTNIKGEDLFMEKDFKNIKSFKEQGKKVYIYMPTFRDTGKDISGWLKSDKIKQFLKENNAVLVCKLHPLDKNSLDFDLSEEFYKMESSSDVYAILKYTDALITDYSSINFDYTLLDRPIMYFVPDLKEYQEQCRGFYTPYEEFAVGDICQYEDELINAMQNVIDGIDNYKEKRKILCDKMFKYQDGKNCERIVELMRSLG